jgi:hypothetical protein
MYDLPPGEIHGKEEGKSGGVRRGVADRERERAGAGRINRTAGMAACGQRYDRETLMGVGKWNDGVGGDGGAESPRADLGDPEGAGEESEPRSSDDAAARREREKRMRLERAAKLLARQRGPDGEKADDTGDSDGDDDSERLRSRSKNSNPDFNPDLVGPGQWRLHEDGVWLRQRV